MSTYYNEETGRYENFENEVAHLIKGVADALSSQSGEGISVVAGVRYDTDDQGLSATEQSNARTNIGAASAAAVESLAESMAGSLEELEDDVEALQDVADVAVTYGTQSLTDAQKAAARGNISAAEAGLVTAHGNVEGFVHYVTATAAETTTLNGVTITRDGYRITLNGTDTSSSVPYVRLTGTLLAKDGDPTSTQAVAGAIKLPEKNNHIYRMTCRLVSGSFTHEDSPRMAGFASNGSAAGNRDVTTDTEATYRDYYNYNGNGNVGFGLRYVAGTVFVNAVFEVTVVDTGSGLGVGEPVIEVSGTSATISALAGACYVCGEMTDLTFKPSINGLSEVIFKSGTTPTVLTISKPASTMSIVMPPWWTGVEASKTYDIMVRNGELVGVSVWA